MVLRRFPWTLAAGFTAAIAAIVASTDGADDGWTRFAFVAALELPATVALTLLAETRRWSVTVRATVLVGSVLPLAAFFLAWPGIDAKHDAIRYFQLSAVLHLGVAFVPFLGGRESVAFWQYNRRLFLGLLRAAVFSGVLFVGLAIALGALDRLFGVDVESETYFRMWLVVAFVVNTWIFLAAVPDDLTALERDTDYPRALRVFAQYILTPLAFTYLAILLAYLVKIVVGGEWPSGWIGWLVASVSVTGLLGFLLVHPLRADPDEGWIRTYARWLFVGLVPAAMMLLVAFWKRILPYGLTEPRMLGLVLGVGLLGIALLFALRPAASIRIIPSTLAALLLLTLYGPASLTRVSVASQGRRLATMLGTGNGARVDLREASAALRFLMERRAGDEIAGRIGRELPPIDGDSLPPYGARRDSLGARIMALAGATYVPEYLRGRADGPFYIGGDDRSAIPVAGFDWVVAVSAGDAGPRAAGSDSVRVQPNSTTGVAHIRAGADTLEFDLRPLATRFADSMPARSPVPSDQLRVEATTGRRRAVLALSSINGAWVRDTLRIDHWQGWLLLEVDSAARHRRDSRRRDS